jgi:hypothetical protein
VVVDQKLNPEDCTCRGIPYVDLKLLNTAKRLVLPCVNIIRSRAEKERSVVAAKNTKARINSLEDQIRTGPGFTTYDLIAASARRKRTSCLRVRQEPDTGVVTG